MQEDVKWTNLTPKETSRFMADKGVQLSKAGLARNPIKTRNNQPSSTENDIGLLI